MLAGYSSLMQFATVYFRPKLDNISKTHNFFSISDEEGLCHKTSTFIKHLGIHQFVKMTFGLVPGREVFAFMKVRGCVVNVVIVFMEHLEFQEVDALLEQVNVSEVLDVQ